MTRRSDLAVDRAEEMPGLREVSNGDDETTFARSNDDTEFNLPPHLVPTNHIHTWP